MHPFNKTLPLQAAAVGSYFIWQNQMSSGGSTVDDGTLSTLFDTMDYESLLKAAKLKDRFHHLISTNQMISKFHLDERTFVISSDTLYGDSLNIDDNHIITNRLDVITDTFTLFGTLIGKVSIFCDRKEPADIETIGNSINQYAFKSLTDVRLLNVKGNPFEHWTNRYETVHRLSLLNIEQIGDMEIHGIFPNVENVEIRHTETVDISKLLHHEFERLNRFTYTGNEDQEQNLREFLQTNRKLQSLEIRTPVSAAFIEYVSKLSNLKSLAVVASRSIDTFSHFTELRHFTLTTRFTPEYDERFPFNFNQLESFVWYTNRIPDAWLKSIKELKTLRKIELPHTAASYDLLTDITNAMGDVTELGAKWNSNCADGIIKIMSETVTLKKVTVSYDRNEVSRDDILKSVCIRRWTLVNERTEELLDYLEFLRQINW